MIFERRSLASDSRTEGLNRAIQEACRQRDEATAEVDRRERVLREALDGDDSGDFDALVVCAKAIDRVRAELEAKNKRLRDALEQIVLWRGADAGATQAADIADAALGADELCVSEMCVRCGGRVERPDVLCGSCELAAFGEHG